MNGTRQTSSNNLTRQSRPLLVKGEGNTFCSFSFCKEKVGMRSFFLTILILLTACTGCDNGDNGKLKPGEFEDPAFKACVEERINYAIGIGLWQKDDPELYNKVEMLECYGGGSRA
ncbi:MAG TPA: hypothetical protein PLV42_02910 [bacterium]|nr:hypothetical protein [bacterium]